MRFLQKILSTRDREGTENYADFCRRWENNRESLESAQTAGELIKKLACLLAEDETARVEERQYLSVTGNGYKYTTRIVTQEQK